MPKTTSTCGLVELPVLCWKQSGNGFSMRLVSLTCVGGEKWMSSLAQSTSLMRRISTRGALPTLPKNPSARPKWYESGDFSGSQ